MSPFECGFVSLCRMYQQTTGIPLRAHPVVVHAGRRMVAVGKPLYLERQSDRHQEIALFCKQVEGAMHSLYLSLQG
jgi:hypothetical protein